MDADGFLVITKRKSCKLQKKRNNNNPIYLCTIEISFKQIKQNVNQAMNQLMEDQYFNIILDILKKILNENILSKIRCFGIGHFGEYESTGTYQIALLLLIQKYYNIPVTIQEPILNEIEINYINQYPNCRYITGVDLTKNEISESQNDYVLFFIPHGENEMYDGILKAHNSVIQRQKMIILGNFLDDISVTYKTFYNYKFWKEYYDMAKKRILPTYNKCLGAFNNTCIMYN
ncbi:Sensitivity To Red Light Reduced-like, SRR1 domain-containing protein [Strongyloides ratti]|uniref:Sensitivity To Red Light Reduced-like, SRR1 domain-containing protein n=1 Tax=Strongyloides ratti TaxID=34506 RepID=A0A090N120_STRRB|nr:Sensitivity To Red Light Reduced-like, SRR1 domain-containing protein [Strongyloides ratti]CEF71673.1 Sensitivity To Red Light Reduced-like, SRR1 domain-containing protein [Strongyloides ratti]